MKPAITPKKQFLINVNIAYKNAQGIIRLKAFPDSYPPVNKRYSTIDTITIPVCVN